MRNLFNWAAARIVAAFAFALPLAAMAVDYTGTDYAPWSYSAGCFVWRASEALFHGSTVAKVAADGTIGAPYQFTNDNTVETTWKHFASNQTDIYTAPGCVLVYDVAGYTASTDAQFAPMSFGGMWVKVLQAEGVPYCITDTKTDGSNRQVELGATGASTYFKFDESFTFNRNSATAVKGTATVEIASGKTFTINARANKGAVIESGSTLVLKGAGTLAVVAGLSVNGTLDLSAATRPTIDGDVGLYGTIVLPAGTEVSSESPFTVCSGTLSGLNVFVKIGDAEAVEKSFTAENGAITSFDDPIYIFYDNYPTVVPAGQTYTFVGGETAESAVTVPSTVSVSGTLKTSGFITVPYYAASTGATLDVIDGTTTLNCGSQAIKGVVTVRENATLVNGTTDAITYGTDRTEVNVYGTVSMGNTRWSLKNTAINMYGGTITGDGQGTNGALDFLLEDGYTGELNAYATSTISASIKFRNTLVPVTVEENAILTLSGVIRTQTSAAGVTKKGVGNLTFTSSPTLPAGIVHENGHLVFSTEDDVNLTTTYTSKPSDTTSLWYARQSNWKGTVVLPVLSDPTALPLDTYGNANSKIVLKGTTGNCYLNGTTTIPAEVVIDTDEDHVVEFNNGNSGQVGTFSKISGTGTLKLTAWGGCSGATYNLNTISNFTGTLAINNGITRGAGGTFTIGIGNIVTTGATTPGSKVLNLAQTAVSGATGTVAYNLVNALVNGEAATLLVGNNGIYIARLLITYPDSTTEYKYEQLAAVLGALYTGYAPDKAGTVVSVLDGSDADLGDAFPLIYDYDSANHTYTLKTMVAYTGDAVKYYYSSIANAIATAEDADTVTLIADVTVDDSINVASGKTITLDLDGHTITGPEDGYAFSNAGTVSISGGTVSAGGIVTNTADGASVAISGGTYTATGDLFGNVEGGTIAVSGGTFNKDVTGYTADGYESKGNGDGTYTVSMAWIYAVPGYWERTGTWSEGATLGEDKVTIESNATYTASNPSAGQMVTVEMTLSFDAENDEDEDLGDVKTAVKIASGETEGSYAFKLYTTNELGRAWETATVGVTALTNVDYTFVFVLDLTNKTYTASIVDGVTTNAMTVGGATNIPFAYQGDVTPVQKIEFIGAGSVTSIEGSYEDAEEPAVFVEDEPITFTDRNVQLSADQAAWLNKLGAKSAVAEALATLSSDQFSSAYLLNLDLTDTFTYEFTVSDITVGDSTVEVEVTLTRTGTLVDGKSSINGTLKLMGGATLPASGFVDLHVAPVGDDDFSDGDTATWSFDKGSEKFFQPVIE